MVQIHSPRLTEPEALQRVTLRGFSLRSPPFVSSVVSWLAHEPLCRVEDDPANRVRIGVLVGCDQRRLIKPATGLHDVLHGVPLPPARWPTCGGCTLVTPAPTAATFFSTVSRAGPLPRRFEFTWTNRRTQGQHHPRQPHGPRDRPRG